MAKLSARGATKIAGFRVSISDLTSQDPHTTWYYRYALRSDGKVLRATARTTKSDHLGTYTAGGTYSILGDWKLALTAEAFETWLRRRHPTEMVTRFSQ